MDKTLLPCPFCGGEAEVKRLRRPVGNGMDWSPRCKDSTCCGRIYKRFESKEKATNAWNRRNNNE